MEIFGDVSRETFWKALFYNNFSRFLRCLKAFWNFFSDDFAFFDGFQVILQCQNIFFCFTQFYKMFHVKHFNFWRFWGINILETLFYSCDALCQGNLRWLGRKNQLIRILLIHRSGIKTVYGCSVIVNVSFVYKMYFYSLELCFFIVLPRFFQIFSIFLFIFISKRHNPWDILFFIFSPVFLFSDGFSLIFFILQARLHIFCFLSIYLISL